MIRIAIKPPHTLLIAFLAACSPFLGAFSQTAGEELATASSLLKNSGGADGSTVLQTMIERVKHLDGYVFDSSLTTYEDGKPVEETGRFFFKPPNLIRFEVIKARNRSGAVVVRQPDGKIRGHMGGIFSGIKTTLAPDSKLLRTANGFNIMDSDIESLLLAARNKLKSNVNCLAGEVAVGGVRPHLVELVASGGTVDDRIEVNWSDKVPSDWRIFHGDKLFSNARFDNLKVESLPDSLFVLGSDTAADSKSFFEEKPYEGDPVLARLQKSDANPLTQNDLSAAEKALKVLQSRCGCVGTETIKSSPGGNQWAHGGRQTLLRQAVELELLLSDLKAVGELLKKQEQKGSAPSAAISQKWLDSVQTCSANTSKLIDMALNDKPDQSSIDTISGALAEQTVKLKDLRKQAATLLLPKGFSSDRFQ